MVEGYESETFQAIRVSADALQNISRELIYIRRTLEDILEELQTKKELE